MRKSVLALTVLATLLGGAGCATDSDDQPPGGDGGGDDAPPFTDGVSTLSGSAEAGYADGRRGVARFANPVNVAVGPDGMIYVADFDNGKIRAVDPEGTTSTVVAITGFQRPFAMAFAGATLYVTTDRDPQGAHGPMAGTIWRVDIAARTATPVAVRVGRPRGLAALPDGTLAASDYTHHVIQRIDPATGGVTLIAGAWDQKGLADGIGAAARFSTPYGLAFVNGALVVADHDNHRLRRVTLDGNVTSLAGSVGGYGDGSRTTAKLNKPQGLAAAGNGDLYVTDLENFRIRRLRGDMLETIAGSGRAGYLDSDDRLEAQLYGLEGVAVSPDGSMVYVADGSRGEALSYHRIRSIKMD